MHLYFSKYGNRNVKNIYHKSHEYDRETTRLKLTEKRKIQIQILNQILLPLFVGCCQTLSYFCIKIFFSWKKMYWRLSPWIIVQLGYNSGHIANPFSPLFHPHRSEYPAPFHLMWPRINNQTILDPLCIAWDGKDSLSI